MLIQTNELETILDSTNLILIDSRSFKEYSDGHIPGAVNLDLFAFHWIDTSKSGFEAFHKQAERLFSFCGISDEKKVVFYDNQSSMLASRGVWLLTYFSHSDVQMLDGGFQKWSKENLLTETKTNNFKPSQFSGKIEPSVMTGFEYIRDNLDKLTIIDARSPQEYDGSIIRAAQGGHIPNAYNIDFHLNISEDGTLKNDNDLDKLYSFPKDAEIVTYCQGAYRAANTFLALKKIGFENVKVYLGSWGEWGNKTELPIEK